MIPNIEFFSSDDVSYKQKQESHTKNQNNNDVQRAISQLFFLMTYYVLFGAFFFTYIGWHIGKSSKAETEQRLAKAKELLDRKVVTEDEYISIRRKIILDN